MLGDRTIGDASIGHGGSMNDARMWRLSNVRQKLVSGQILDGEPAEWHGVKLYQVIACNWLSCCVRGRLSRVQVHSAARRYPGKRSWIWDYIFFQGITGSLLHAVCFVILTLLVDAGFIV